jgi:hypothetical protein
MKPSKKRFVHTLVELRKSLGFSSSLGFFRELQNRGAIEVNYSQYMRIETGKVGAKPEFVYGITKIYPDCADRLVTAYCSDIFPEQAHLFGEARLDAEEAISQNPLLIPQVELTRKQVMNIAKSEMHYVAYLVLTLSRKTLNRAELERSIVGFDSKVLQDLIQCEVLSEMKGGYYSRAKERIFPVDDSREVIEAYSRLDRWDLNLERWLRSEKIYRQSLVRRVSPRYIPIIKKYAENLIDLLNASDEVDSSRNTSAIALTINIKRMDVDG